MLEIIRNAHDSRQVTARLVEWGRWSACQSEFKGVSSPMAAILASNQGVSQKTPVLISDDEAEFIGKAVKNLQKTNPAYADVVRLYFCGQITSVRTLAARLSVSKSRAAELIKEVVAWFQGYFCGRFG